MSEQAQTAGFEFTIGDRLRRAREYAGLEQEELAAEIGISRGTVSNYERGQTEPKPLALNAWALRCGVPAEWIRSGVASYDGPGGPITRPYPLTRSLDFTGRDRDLLALVA